MPSQNEPETASLLRETLELTQENNRLLRKMHRNTMIGMWSQLLWYAILIGLPFALYFYILEPYVEAFGSSFKEFQSSVRELPGYKLFQMYMEEQKNK